MIASSWLVSGIVGGVILIIVIPLLLWIRYSKAGRQAFLEARIKSIDNRLQTTKEELQSLDWECKVLTRKLKTTSQKRPIQAKLNKTKKAVVLAKRKIGNLKIEKQNQRKIFQKIIENKALK